MRAAKITIEINNFLGEGEEFGQWCEQVSWQPVRTIGQILPSKDPYNPEEKSCVIYQVPCSDCNFVYIGQTKRDLKSRLAEHKLAIKSQESEKSALCEHYMRFDHIVDWNNSKILKTEAHYSK